MNVLHTPYGSFNLAKEDNRKRVKHIVMSLQQTTDALTRKGMADGHQCGVSEPAKVI